MNRLAIWAIVAFAVTALGFSATAQNKPPAPPQPWEEKTAAIGAITNLPEGQLSGAQLEKLVATGEQLFTAKFTILDGAGRPRASQASIPTKRRNTATQAFARTSGPDSNGCSSCHNDPVAGGAGDFVTTVFAAAGFVNADFDTTDPQFSNERGTNHIFGSGLVELLAREMTADLAKLRMAALKSARSKNQPATIALFTKGISFGQLTAFTDGQVDVENIVGVDADLIVRPFSQKGVVNSLRRFTVNALNHHHGMQASERFGPRWTGEDDFDGDGISAELSPADVSALVAWQASRKPPIISTPTSAAWQDAAKTGEQMFGAFGCNACHVSVLPLKSLVFIDPAELDGSGTLGSAQVRQPASYDLGQFEWAKNLARNDGGEILVPIFGDLKRHQMTDGTIEKLGNELLSQAFVDRTFFITSELWGVGSTAPYGHRNDFTTLDEVILAHGGEARQSRDKYAKASDRQRLSIVAFLKTLVIE